MINKESIKWELGETIDLMQDLVEQVRKDAIELDIGADEVIQESKYRRLWDATQDIQQDLNNIYNCAGRIYAMRIMLGEGEPEQ